jgi:VTC domain
MEVKADDRVPEWTTSLLARHGCQLTRVSKYCAGVARLKGINVMPLAMSPGVDLPPLPPQATADGGPAAGEPTAAETRAPDESVRDSVLPISEPTHG